MKFLRTPDARFDNLPDYDFEPHYCEVRDGLRVHYVDTGPRTGRVIILMHGEPSWSYLYRFMISHLSAAGFRVLAPDLIGFGKSDKPTALSDYSYTAHVAWMQDWLDHVDVKDAVLFCQDWGGLIGLRLVADNPERFAAVMAGIAHWKRHAVRGVFEMAKILTNHSRFPNGSNFTRRDGAEVECG
jgi:haloalkane dehalogenase